MNLIKIKSKILGYYVLFYFILGSVGLEYFIIYRNKYLRVYKEKSFLICMMDWIWLVYREVLLGGVGLLK